MAESVTKQPVTPVAVLTAKTSVVSRFWSQVQIPVLAFVSAFAVGGVIIILSDLAVFAEFQKAFANPLSLFGLALAVAVIALAIVASRNASRLLSRVVKTPTPLQERLTSIATLILGVGLGVGLLRLTGLAQALDAAWNAVRLAYGSLLEGSLGNPAAILESLVASTPYIFAGLAVALGFRCGLFNIGAEGQLFVGATFAAYVGYSLVGVPAIIHIPLALGAGALGGALWGFLPGILKAKFGAHEVINTIMMNYIAFRLSEWLLNGPMKREGSVPVSPTIQPSAELPTFFPEPIRFHLGFFIALGVAAFVYWFLFRTTWGFEIRTVGANPNAARYAGMSITRNFVLAMCLSGALAGLAGANEVLGVNHNLALAFSSGYGFDSIALALLGKSHPLGVVLAALLFGTLRSGGTRMQNVARIPVDIIGVVQALVIAFVAAPAIIRAIYRIRAARSTEVVFTRGWGR